MERPIDSLSATDNYLSLYLSLPGLPPEAVLSLFLLTLARIIPIASLAPFLGAKNVPMTIRMMFSVALVALFLPPNLLLAKTTHFSTPLFSGLILKELLFGTILGFLASLPFYIAQMAGSLIDHQRGSSSLQVSDPTTQSQTGPIGILYNYILIALFFSLNGPFLFFNGLATSYELIPVDQWISPTALSFHGTFWKEMRNIAEKIFELSIQLSAPALIGILVTDLFLGIANRLAPQVQIVFLGMPLKSWVGIALLAAAWGLIFKVMGQEAITWIETLNRWIDWVGRS